MTNFLQEILNTQPNNNAEVSPDDLALKIVDNKKLDLVELDRSTNFFGKVVAFLSKIIFGVTFQNEHQQAIKAYLNELKKVDYEIFDQASNFLEHPYMEGTPLTLRCIQQLGEEEFLPSITNRVNVLLRNASLSSISEDDKKSLKKDAECLLKSLELVKAHQSTNEKKAQIDTLVTQINGNDLFKDLATKRDHHPDDIPERGRAELPPIFIDDILHLYNNKEDVKMLVSTGLTLKQVLEIHQALDRNPANTDDRLKDGIGEKRERRLLKNAIHIINCTGYDDFVPKHINASSATIIALASRILCGDYSKLWSWKHPVVGEARDPSAAILPPQPSITESLHDESLSEAASLKTTSNPTEGSSCEEAFMMISHAENELIKQYKEECSRGEKLVTDVADTRAPSIPASIPLKPMELLQLRNKEDSQPIQSLPEILLQQLSQEDTEKCLGTPDSLQNNLDNLTTKISQAHKDYQNPHRNKRPKWLKIPLSPDDKVGITPWNLGHCPYAAHVIGQPILVVTDYEARLFLPDSESIQISEENKQRLQEKHLVISFDKHGCWQAMESCPKDDPRSLITQSVREKRNPSASENFSVSDVRNFVAEIFSPTDIYDSKVELEEQRIQNIISQNQPLVQYMMNNQELVMQAEVPTPFIEAIKEMMTNSDLNATEDTLCKILVSKIDAWVEKLNFNQINGVTNLASVGFSEVDQQSLTYVQIYLKKVFSSYFNNQLLKDKKSLLASYYREAKPEDSENTKLVALLKGSGPYLQKLIQLYGDEVPNADLKRELANVKSNLQSIPREARDAYLASIVRKSQGAILSIKVMKSLGAASVGETYLVEITRADGRSEPAVAKILRPGLELRAQREENFLMQEAQNIPGMEITIQGVIAQVQREMNLENEAERIREARTYYDHDPSANKELQMVELCDGVPVLPYALLLKQAPGINVHTYMKNLHDILDGRICLPPNKAMSLYKDTTDLAAKMMQLATLWVREGCFGSGFYHGDLHSGNIMFSAPSQAGGTGVMTIIDFGNAAVVSPKDQNSIAQLIFAILRKDPKSIEQSFINMLTPETSQQYKDNIRIQQCFQDGISSIISASNNNNSGEIVERILSLACELGLGLPAVLANFSRSQRMLERTMHDLRILRQRLVEINKELLKCEYEAGVARSTWAKNIDDLFAAKLRSTGEKNPDDLAFISSITDKKFHELSTEQQERVKDMVGCLAYKKYILAETIENINNDGKPYELPEHEPDQEEMSDFTCATMEVLEAESKLKLLGMVGMRNLSSMLSRLARK